MKIDRLIGILSVLLQEEKTTAPELAERFEVSRRTINRDIEDLCKAGIPIRTAQGTGGGISIMDGYRMDRTILTSKDMQMILAGLRSLDSVSGSKYYGQLMEKIQAGSSEFITGRDSILIDLSSWYRESLAPKVETLQEAIEFLTVEEGLCVQCMHIGSYDDEPATVAMMHEVMEQQGYELDITDKRLHHEIYLSDARKVAPEKLKTVIRHPIKVKGDLAYGIHQSYEG